VNVLIELLAVGGQPGRQPCCASRCCFAQGGPAWAAGAEEALVVPRLYTLLTAITSTVRSRTSARSSRPCGRAPSISVLLKPV